MRGNKGFLLVEVMAAIVLLAFGLVYVTRAFNNCLNTMAQVSRYTIASALAEDKFFELEMDAGGQLKPEAKGVFSEYPDFSFDVAVDEVKDLQLKEIGVTTRWKHGRRTGSFEVRGYVPVKE